MIDLDPTPGILAAIQRAARLDPGAPITSATPIDSLCADMTDRWTLACAVEESAAVEFSERAIEEWDTVADIITGASMLQWRLPT